MEHVFCRSLSTFIKFSLIVAFIIPILQTNQTFSQQISEEEKAGRMAQKYLNESALQQKDGGGNNPAALNKKFFTGQAANDQFGSKVSNAGDINGDGYDDIIVGAPFNDAGGTDAGRVYIYFGGVSMDNIADVIINGEAASDNFGYSISAAGDVNGDGYDDIIVGAPYHDIGANDMGRAYVYLGGDPMNTTQVIVLNGVFVSDHFGHSVSYAGDVNGDGYSDVIVGAIWNDAGGSNAGRAYIYLGGASMNNTVDVVLTGAEVNDEFGYSVSDAGDANGDGYGDVIVGAPYNDEGFSNGGRAYLYFGGSSMNNSADVIFGGSGVDDNLGYSVSTAGDVNGDGYSDLIVGAPFNDVGGTNSGRVFIFYGGTSINSIAKVILTGKVANGNLGWSVADAGDVNGDGYGDVIAGAYSWGTITGKAYIYFGDGTMDNIADVIMSGEAEGDNLGISVSTAGDVNGDGYSDVIVGANGSDVAAAGAGRAYLYLNSLSGIDIPDESFTGSVSDDMFGWSVSEAGDVNGDGYADIIVGALYNDAAGTNAGRVYIFYGGSVLDTTADVILSGDAAAGAEFGFCFHCRRC